MNAIYFKGSWKHQFNASRTFKGDFHLGSNETVQVDYMTTKEKFKFGENEELKSSVVVLPYEVSQPEAFFFFKKKKLFKF